MNSFSNSSSSLLQQKIQRAIDDQLASPVSNSALMFAFMLGGFIRGVIIAGITFITAALLIDLPVVHPLLFLGSLTVCGLFFASLGVTVGLRSETFDNLSFYQTFIIQPLIFLGGVFYAVTLLPEPFKTLTYFDPLYYMISSVRFGMLGISGVNPYLSIFVVTLATAALIVLNLLLFKKGYRLRS